MKTVKLNEEKKNILTFEESVVREWQQSQLVWPQGFWTEGGERARGKSTLAVTKSRKQCVKMLDPKDNLTLERNGWRGAGRTKRPALASICPSSKEKKYHSRTNEKH